MVHREIVQGPKEVTGNLREVHKNLREVILVFLKVIGHIFGSQRGHLGPRKVTSGFMIVIWGL